MNQFCRCPHLGLALACLALAHTSIATPIGPGQGLVLSQVDLSFPAVPAQPASQYGLAAVNVSQMLSAAALPAGGFLNISTAQGWVLQNLPIDPGMTAAGYAGNSIMFDLGLAPGRLTSLTIAADFSSSPVTVFSAVPNLSFNVGRVELNAQGGIGPQGGDRSGPTDHRIAPVGFNAQGETFSIWQPRHSSVETGTNQCGPAALANSFQYLEARYGLTGTQAHADIPGVGGVPPNSRVGQFDLTTMRAQTGCKDARGNDVACGITEEQFFKGKTKYIQDNGLVKNLSVKSYGAEKGDQTLNGVFIDDQTTDGLTLVDWLLRELRHGEDIELWLDWDGGGAHMVDLIGGGMVAGVPWFAWVHDFTQGDNSIGTAFNDGGVGYSYFDAKTGCWTNYVGSGRGLDEIQCARFKFAASESVPEPGSLLLLSGGLLCLYVRRRRPPQR